MRSIRVVNDDGMVRGTKVYDAASGAEIRGIGGMTINLDVDASIVTANVRMLGIAAETRADAAFQIADPVTGKLREVASIIFADGERIDF